MGRLDLDAQRSEANDEPHTVVLGGREWKLPARFPLVAGQRMQEGEVEGAIAMLFGEDAVETLSPLFSTEDLEAIADQLYDLTDRAQRAQTTATNGNGNGNRAARRAAASNS